MYFFKLIKAYLLVSKLSVFEFYYIEKWGRTHSENIRRFRVSGMKRNRASTSRVCPSQSSEQLNKQNNWIVCKTRPMSSSSTVQQLHIKLSLCLFTDSAMKECRGGTDAQLRAINLRTGWRQIASPSGRFEQ